MKAGKTKTKTKSLYSNSKKGKNKDVLIDHR